MTFNIVGPAAPLVELESRTLDYGRFYKIDNQWMPSITTVVGHNTKASILAWEERVGYTTAEQIRRAAAWRGTKYHTIVEHYLKNELEKVEKSEGLPKYMFGFARKTLDRISDIHILEAPLYSRRLGVAGRVDCIAHFDGELAIIDFKTTKQLKKEEHLDKFFVQEAAYAYMYYELTGVEVDKLVTLSVAEDGSTQVVQKYDKIPYIDTLIEWIKEYNYYVRSIK
jgi:CRISPR/Cas system-associated exonuclease Cas4 (RecB family)